jgi:osmoprotectant transport system substrate-binding protein
MKTIKMAILMAMVLMLFVPAVYACVGKTLTIGVTNSTEGKVFAEMLSTLVNERTGTTINIKFFDKRQDIYEAVRKQDVDISIENTTRALNVLNMPQEADIKKAYKMVKVSYEKEKGLIWLKPFGFTNVGSGESPAYTATILRMDILNNFPALPRLFNKLGSKINDAAYEKLIKSVESGEEPKEVAKDFLKSKKLI